MTEAVKSITEKLKKDKKPLIIIAVGFVGILLLLISSVSEKDISTSAAASEPAVTIEKLEKILTALIESVDGAGQVKVMVTLDAYDERIYAVNKESESNADSYEQKEEYVLTDSSGDTDGLTVRIIAPSVRGVGISCEGASSDVIKMEITRLVSATLGISVNKIWVTAMEE